MPKVDILPERDGNDEYHGWKVKRLRRDANLKGIQNILNSNHPEGWGVDEVVKYENERVKRDNDSKSAKLQGPKAFRKQTNQSIESRYNELISSFDAATLTENDKELVRQLAVSELQARRFGELLDEALRSDTPKPLEVDKLASAQKTAMAQCRDIQNMLGIARVDRQESATSADLVAELVKGAQEHLDKWAVKIRCPKCLAEPQHTEIDQGFILNHFKDNCYALYIIECPRCGCLTKLGKRDIMMDEKAIELIKSDKQFIQVEKPDTETPK